MKLEGWIVKINGKYVACEDKEFLKEITRHFGYTHVDDKKILKITITIPDSEASDGFDPENIPPLEEPDGSVSIDELKNLEPDSLPPPEGSDER